jgi:hypothetical protein
MPWTLPKFNGVFSHMLKNVSVEPAASIFRKEKPASLKVEIAVSPKM